MNLTISDEAYHRVRQLAEQRQQEISEVVEDLVRSAVPKENAQDAMEATDRAAVVQEQKAYHRLYPMLKTRYLGRHVAICQGELIDHDEDGMALSLRIRQAYPEQFVLIRQVEAEPEPLLYFRSPRLITT